MRNLVTTTLLAVLALPVSVQAHFQVESTEENGDYAGEILPSLVLVAPARGARLGIHVGSGSWSDQPVEGLELGAVTPGGPAEKAGLRAGDLLTTINGDSLAAENSEKSFAKLRAVLDEVEAGSEVTVEYRRGADELEAKVTTGNWGQLFPPRVGESPRSIAEQAKHWARSMSNWAPSGGNMHVEVGGEDDGGDTLVRIVRGAPRNGILFSEMAWRLGGLQVMELTPVMGEYFGTERGLLVVRGPEDEDVPLQDGDVIREIGGREVKDARHATRILRSYEPGEEIQLGILRHKRNKTVGFELPERVRRGRPQGFRAPLHFPHEGPERGAPGLGTGGPLSHPALAAPAVRGVPAETS